jgi:hypothetical protein
MKNGPGPPSGGAGPRSSHSTDKVAGRVASADRPPIAANLHGPVAAPCPVVRRSCDLARVPSQCADQRARPRARGTNGPESPRFRRPARSATPRISTARVHAVRGSVAARTADAARDACPDDRRRRRHGVTGVGGHAAAGYRRAGTRRPDIAAPARGGRTSLLGRRARGALPRGRGARGPCRLVHGRREAIPTTDDAAPRIQGPRSPRSMRPAAIEVTRGRGFSR